jgi:hypothetical protein
MVAENSDVEKKRSRKKKDEGVKPAVSNSSFQNIQIVIDDVQESSTKKRGRKPKGGKLIVKNSEPSDKPPPVSNVILHLKCSMKDLDDYNNNMNKMVSNPLNYNPDVPPTIMTYSTTDSSGFSSYESRKEDSNFAYTEQTTNCYTCSKCLNNSDEDISENKGHEDDEVNIKDTNQKLKRLKMNLYKNSMNDKKSACFWCTFDFDNQSCYIPKYEIGRAHV